MKKFFTAAAAAALLSGTGAAYAQDLLTGDAKLACEATLCLSSGDRPSECNESIRKYFSIKHKRLHKQLQARKNFLKLCPTSNEQGMPELVNAVAEGAGRCDAAELNRVMRRTVTVRECQDPKTDTFSIRRYGQPSCKNVRKTIVLNAKPSYCTAYHQHGWTTAGENVRYVGDPKNGGRWVNR